MPLEARTKRALRSLLADAINATTEFGSQLRCDPDLGVAPNIASGKLFGTDLPFRCGSQSDFGLSSLRLPRRLAPTEFGVSDRRWGLGLGGGARGAR